MISAMDRMWLEVQRWHYHDQVAMPFALWQSGPLSLSIVNDTWKAEGSGIKELCVLIGNSPMDPCRARPKSILPPPSTYSTVCSPLTPQQISVREREMQAYLKSPMFGQMVADFC